MTAPRRAPQPLSDDRLWTIREVAYYAGGCDVSTIRRLPIPWTNGSPNPNGHALRLYDPKDVKAYFAARKRKAS